MMAIIVADKVSAIRVLAPALVTEDSFWFLLAAFVANEARKLMAGNKACHQSFA